MILSSDIIEAVLQREGTTFTDRPEDKGGPTCCGVTLPIYAAYRGEPTTVEDLKQLTPAIAREVYQHLYIDAPGFGKIAHPALEALMVDAGVQHGPGEATRMAQRALGIVAHGVFDAATLTVFNQADVRALYLAICATRIRFYGSLISHDKELELAKSHGYELQADNAFGWANRIAKFVETPI